MSNLLKDNRELMKEWNYEKNKDIDINRITSGSSRKVWWICPKGHDYLTDPHHRSNGVGCPICAGKEVLRGYNDLASTNKDILKFWDYKKNLDITPDKITKGSGKKVWWICPNCNYNWNAVVYSVVKRKGCPICNRKKGLKYRERNTLFKVGSFADKYPELAKEWDCEKNNISVDEVLPYSAKKVWWICPNGHSYKASLNHRSNGTGCPYCSNRKLLIGYNDLKTNYPKLVKEWDYSSNKDLKPSDFTFSSGKKVWWICAKCNNRYIATISKRVHGTGCPVCNHMLVKEGINDFKSRFPVLVEEWDYKKNNGVLPESLSFGSGKKVWWICPRCGNSYNSSVSNRTRGTGCPKCSGEIQTSFPEQAIFFYLKNEIKCENRKKIDKKELDIYIPSLKIGIEYNGKRYHKNKTKDLEKVKYFKKIGIDVISINESNINSVSNNTIDYKYTSNYKYLNWVINEIFKIINLPLVKIDIKNDSIKIYEQYITAEKENSLYNKYPEISKEWDNDKNGDITPKLVRPASNRKFWWKCPKGHSYKSSINSRTNGCGCPYCSGQKVLKGFNDLKSKYPNIAEEWDYKKNKELSPDMVTSSTAKQVWWICPNNHSYYTRISHRTKGVGCPICANLTRMKSRNENYILLKGSLKDNYPELMKEWNYEKNIDITPDKVLAHSGKKVWWKCSKCSHEWLADPNHRVNGRGCPKCKNKK